jgi:hypothetical protein
LCYSQTNEYVRLSADLLEATRAGTDTKALQAQLSDLSIDQLQAELDTDAKKFAFWVNIYNAYIQIILSEKPELYEDRRTFFKEPYIDMAGRTMAFADIEHGIIRRSALELFLGYLTNPFAPSWQKDLRVKERDYRIHFALNCGAKSCPPVTVYLDDKLDEQFDYMTKTYLAETTEYIADQDLAKVVSLFSWFRGDFGGGDGIRDILVQYEATPQRPSKVETTAYDWTLDLDNWR